jgi:MOSC domain-containing protein YiiM
MTASITAVSRSSRHRFGKRNELSIRLVAGSGVEGDAHAGETIQHRFSAQKHRRQPNLRQVHLMHEEFLDELRSAGFDVWPGALGDNITTRGIDLLALPQGTLLRLGKEVVLRLTGLRAPCRQLNKFAAGLASAVMSPPDLSRQQKSRAGVMAVVVNGGEIKPGDNVAVDLPAGAALPLKPV